jgi:hypothetical protein
MIVTKEELDHFEENLSKTIHISCQKGQISIQIPYIIPDPDPTWSKVSRIRIRYTAPKTSSTAKLYYTSIYADPEPCSLVSADPDRDNSQNLGFFLQIPN